ncbi:MAG: TraR/DksA C4-type zinc finger protein [Bacteroidota bacterium]
MAKKNNKKAAPKKAVKKVSAKKVVKKVAPKKAAKKVITKKPVKPTRPSGVKVASKKVVKKVVTKKAAPKKAVKKVTSKKVVKKVVTKKAAPKKVVKKVVPKKVVKKVVTKKAAPKKVVKKVAPKKVVKKVIAKKVTPKKAVKKVAPKKVVKPVVAKKIVKKAEVKKVTKSVAKPVKPIVKKVVKPVAKPVVKPVIAKKQNVVVKHVTVTIDKTAEERKPTPSKNIVFPDHKDETIAEYVESKRYSDNDLIEFKTLINSKIAVAKTELANLIGQMQNPGLNAAAETDNSYKTLEDGASTAEKEYISQLAVRQRKFIENLENALVRIENKTYGICRVTGKLISKERLRAVPHTTLSMEAKLQQYK